MKQCRECLDERFIGQMTMEGGETYPCNSCTEQSRTMEERFTSEFGIHFEDSSGELQFALAFIEEEISLAVQKERERVKHILFEIQFDFLDYDDDKLGELLELINKD